ncbi:type II secretion system F family protein [Thermococcus sp. 21S9]|uniref:type II secretion system F family protein n=1 Tax=Thermococcus sp. 21S9 TaxID=1638223 RepID=UPI00143A5FEA|nr:type II secretion system F family protein [Thermococcus sp. 21S9]NJE54410.1 type II secretion system F family protein [Thermococcus sp. 21S9]
MARKGISSLLVALFERIIPERYLKRYELYIYSAGINFLATEYLVVSFLLGVIAGLAVSLLTNGLYGLLAFLVGFLGMAFVYPYWRTSKRIEDMERNLPDAFFYLASSLRAGISFSEALEELTTAKFGALTEEFKKTVAEIKKGRSTVDALRAFAIRNRKSQVIYRSMMIIIEALERGAPMSDVLVFVGNDVREILRIKQERKASTGMQAMFFIVTSGFVGPMILGIVTKVMESMSGPGTGVNLPVASMTNILFIFVIIQALVSGLGIGVIREGSYNAGLKYAALLVAMSSVIFKGATLINIGF